MGLRGELPYGERKVLEKRSSAAERREVGKGG